MLAVRSFACLARTVSEIWRAICRKSPILSAVPESGAIVGDDPVRISRRFWWHQKTIESLLGYSAALFALSYVQMFQIQYRKTTRNVALTVCACLSPLRLDRPPAQTSSNCSVRMLLVAPSSSDDNAVYLLLRTHSFATCDCGLRSLPATVKATVAT